MNTVNCSCNNGCVKCNQFNPCAVTCGCPVERFGDYAYIYNTAAQTVASDSAVTFSDNGPLSGTITHTAGTADIAIGRTGVYLVKYYLESATASEVSVFQNSQPIAGSTRTLDDTANGEIIAVLQTGDVLTLVNTGDAEVSPEEKGAPPEAVVNASMTIVRLF